MTERTKGADEKFCLECAAIIKAKAVICPKCGCPQGSGSTAIERNSLHGKDKNTAGLLAMLLGGLGVHKFYLNQTKDGVLCMLFCWTFVPALLGLVDGVKLFRMSGVEFDRLYNSD